MNTIILKNTIESFKIKINIGYLLIINYINCYHAWHICNGYSKVYMCLDINDRIILCTKVTKYKINPYLKGKVFYLGLVKEIIHEFK